MSTPVTANSNPREDIPPPLGFYFRSRSGCLVRGCTHLGRVQPHRSLFPDRGPLRSLSLPPGLTYLGQPTSSHWKVSPGGRSACFRPVAVVHFLGGEIKRQKFSTTQCKRMSPCGACTLTRPVPRRWRPRALLQPPPIPRSRAGPGSVSSCESPGRGF